MAIVRIIQPPVGQEMYDAVSAKLSIAADPPEGLVMHCAGDANGTWQIIEVWESEEQAQQFENDRLGPTIGEIAGPDAPDRSEVPTTSYELHNLVAPRA
jgi:hypothetical protein